MGRIRARRATQAQVAVDERIGACEALGVAPRFALWLALLAVACGSDPAAQGSPPSDAGSALDGVTSDGAWPDASGGSSSGGTGGTGGTSGTAGASTDAATDEPCPALTVPTTCFGREVMFREWGPAATGDGTFFADQAPYRLGFNRVNGRVWIVKFKTEDASYRGRISAYGDSQGGVTWISDDPCDAAFGVANKLVSWSNHGGGSLDFLVVRKSDEPKLDTDPTLASWAKSPRLYAGHCYYVSFENTTDEFPSLIDKSYIETIGDDCGVSGDGTCYYLAMDFGHLLHDIGTGQLIAGNVIPGLTQ